MTGSRLEGDVAIVTGSGGSIGRATALRLASDGASVMVGDVDTAAAAETVGLIEEIGGQAASTRLDVTDEASVQDAVSATVEALGEPSILVNNAGVGGKGRTILETTLEHWQRIIDVNLTGVFLCTQAVGRRMAQAGTRGRIVNLASTESQIVTYPGLSHYAASKAGVHLLTKAAALEFAPLGIRVNAVGPGWVHTNMNAKALADPDRKAWAEAEIPLGRLASPDDIADVIAFLASDDARYMTGALVFVDGGVMIGSERPFPGTPAPVGSTAA
jgi:NAD(P)-dependent dehydrogenase (short-subunit alcohol dehydrogenase family)